jgi:hypothetical protein
MFQVAVVIALTAWHFGTLLRDAYRTVRHDSRNSELARSAGYGSLRS